jgi:hypothetical protein
MEKIDFMQELFKLLLDWLKKQASQVVILSAGLFFMYNMGSEQLVKLESKIERQEQKIDEQGAEIRKCDMERSALEVELNFMRYTLEQRFPNLKLKNFH